MEKIGKIVYCDRCGVSGFKEEINPKDTLFRDFRLYKGCDNWGRKNGKDLCPHCFALIKQVEEMVLNGLSVSIRELENRQNDVS